MAVLISCAAELSVQSSFDSQVFHLHILQLNDADWSRVLPGAAEIQHLLILFMQVVHTVRHDKAHHSIVYSAHNSCWNRSLNHFVRQAKLWYKSC